MADPVKNKCLTEKYQRFLYDLMKNKEFTGFRNISKQIEKVTTLFISEFGNCFQNEWIIDSRRETPVALRTQEASMPVDLTLTDGLLGVCEDNAVVWVS